MCTFMIYIAYVFIYGPMFLYSNAQKSRYTSSEGLDRIMQTGNYITELIYLNFCRNNSSNKQKKAKKLFGNVELMTLPSTIT